MGVCRDWISVLHQKNGDDAEKYRQRDDGSAYDAPQSGVDPGPYRAGSVEPGARRCHHGDADQCQGDAVPAVPGSISPARPTERAVDPTPLPPSAMWLAPDGRSPQRFRHRRSRSLRSGLTTRARPASQCGELVVDLVVRLAERAAVLFAMPARLVPLTPSAP